MDAPQPEVDISKQTLVVLVALSCIISIIGVIAMVYELSSANPTRVINNDKQIASAQASLTIDGPAQKFATQGTGFATFQLKGE